MERETEDDPAIDMTAPGSETDQADGVAAQIPYEDMLEPHLTDDILDEGFSPPDRPPGIEIPTPAEERAGEGLERRLAEEEPDAAPDSDAWRDTDSSAGDRRAGRLTAEDDDSGSGDPIGDVAADDVGIAGGAASGEEAAMYIIDGDEE